MTRPTMSKSWCTLWRLQILFKSVNYVLRHSSHFIMLVSCRSRCGNVVQGIYGCVDNVLYPLRI
jgi:hypothetical protein